RNFTAFMKKEKELEEIRRIYSDEELRKSKADSDPFKQFSKWFDQAAEAEIPEPTAMILSTASRKGIPSVRTVLLKGFDKEGFIFFTNYNSAKGKNLSENPFAEALFLWKEIERQVRISGRAEKISREQSESYFKTRAYESKIGAWASEQGRLISSREFLEQRYKEYLKKYPNGDVPMPDYWGGYKLFPEKFEFWQGREHRLHDRIIYLKKENKWEKIRLSP
ncbi:MAG TPA: pyridoxamine 5'-phosphate oxidase, partial [Ignavibacteriaceae bacterium]|nr:pyridoxamine 5'-phosphate oxidase [Ignavibacteriaceae bacterium]